MTILLISTIISVWEPLIIDKHWPELIQCIKLALNDADSETRANARQTFECLQNQYSAKADALFHVIILIIRKTYFWPKKISIQDLSYIFRNSNRQNNEFSPVDPALLHLPIQSILNATIFQIQIVACTMLKTVNLYSLFFF